MTQRYRHKTTGEIVEAKYFDEVSIFGPMQYFQLSDGGLPFPAEYFHAQYEPVTENE